MTWQVVPRYRFTVAESNRRRRKPRPPAGSCPICGADLPDLPPSLRRKYCSIQCAGVVKRGKPRGGGAR